MPILSVGGINAATLPTICLAVFHFCLFVRCFAVV